MERLDVIFQVQRRAMPGTFKPNRIFDISQDSDKMTHMELLIEQHLRLPGTINRRWQIIEHIDEHA